MGKKSRVKTQKSGPGGAATVASPKEMMSLVSELLQLCSSTAPSPGKEWEDYVQIRGLVEKIRKKQKGEDYFPELMAWAQECGASTEGFEVASFGEEGYGLRATRDIKVSPVGTHKTCQLTQSQWPAPCVHWITFRLFRMFSPLYSQDRILQAMSNVTLALHLLCERASPSSPWLPYIKSLPADYDTPLYYEEEEVRHLLGTQAVQDVLSQYKNTARQYAYFYKVVQTHPTASKLPLKDSFTYDDYRWAVSSVMTRQNQIPTEDGSRVTLALIPLWDMCNHTNGLITTGYNLEDDRCECVALQDYKENEQPSPSPTWTTTLLSLSHSHPDPPHPLFSAAIAAAAAICKHHGCIVTDLDIYIFYGTRSNAEFVVHSGFFFEDNGHDRVKIKLGVSKSERLYAMKAEVLARAGIAASSIFAVHCTEPPISAQLLAFLRVFCMTEGEEEEENENEEKWGRRRKGEGGGGGGVVRKEELKDYLVGEGAINKIFPLGNSGFPVSLGERDQAVDLPGDPDRPAPQDLQDHHGGGPVCAGEARPWPPHSRVAVQLRLAEKQILEKASASGRANRLHFQRQLEEGAALPRYEESDIALLENDEAVAGAGPVTDAKLPIILCKLEDVVVEEEEAAVSLKEAQEERLEKTPLLLNGGKAVYGTDAGQTDLAAPAAVEANGVDGAPTQAVTAEEASKAVGSALDTSTADLGQKDPADGGPVDGGPISAN
ncbi:hypothetical protein CRUP_015159 [Coryphaenoides rupestris]|nr:hypothetical protein CRUP_015159 [Coryphaenoides rupestris]